VGEVPWPLVGGLRERRDGFLPGASVSVLVHDPPQQVGVDAACELLREVMRETRTTQSELSRLSGVRQPSISQFLSGTVELSDDQLDRLLSCMGYRLEVTRRPVVPELTRSERRSWRFHCRLSVRLTPASLQEWRPVIERNLGQLRGSVTGPPHSRNLDRWESLVRDGDVPGPHRVLTGLDRDSIEMREVSPMGGLLPQDERQAALREGQADATRPD
jgi:transcriptional regulator with XRE-family HTH domain